MKRCFILLGFLSLSITLFAQVDSSSSVFRSDEKAPEFPGGEKALFEFLGKNIVYPKKARKENIQGVVPVTFIIDTSGKVTNVKIGHDIGGGCGEEAKRVIESMPRWKPGTQNDKPVDVHYSIKINFSMNDHPQNKMISWIIALIIPFAGYGVSSSF